MKARWGHEHRANPPLEGGLKLPERSEGSFAEGATALPFELPASFPLPENRCRTQIGCFRFGHIDCRTRPKPSSVPSICRLSHQTRGLPVFGSKVPKSEKSDFGGRARSSLARH